MAHCCQKGRGQAHLVRTEQYGLLRGYENHSPLQIAPLVFCHLLATLGAEQETHLPGIQYGFVLVAVIEQDMHLTGLV